MTKEGGIDVKYRYMMARKLESNGRRFKRGEIRKRGR